MHHQKGTDAIWKFSRQGNKLKDMYQDCENDIKVYALRKDTICIELSLVRLGPWLIHDTFYKLKTLACVCKSVCQLSCSCLCDLIPEQECLPVELLMLVWSHSWADNGVAHVSVCVCDRCNLSFLSRSVFQLSSFCVCVCVNLAFLERIISKGNIYISFFFL